MIETINPQPTKEKPILTDSYPYGFKRTSAKWYIETTKQGQRVVFQTLNPKTNLWNKEKKSTYSDIRILYKNLENNHIENAGLSFTYDGKEELDLFLKDFESWLSDYQKEKIKVFRAIIETRKYIKVTVREEPQYENDDIRAIIKEKEQEEIKQGIKKIFVYNLKQQGVY